MLEHFRGNETFVRRMQDQMDLCLRQNRWIITPFLTPLEQEIAKCVIGKQVETIWDGGYEDAEMLRLAMGPYQMDVDLEIVCLKSKYAKQERVLTHRDVLGALMHLGIARNQFGDLLVQEDCIYVFVRREIATLLQQELTQIARYTVCFEEVSEQLKRQEELVFISKTLSSLRLDCVVAACCNQSRSKAESLIKGKLVKVDHKPLEDCKCLCNNNSTVSIRGYGRFQLKTDGKTSKKGRIIVEIGKFSG